MTRDLPSKLEGKPSGQLTIKELDAAEEVLLRQAQSECFAEDLAFIGKGKMVQKTSRLSKLSPKLNEKGIIVLRGRLEYASWMDDDTRRPTILDPKHRCTLLLIQKEHERLGHHGKEQVLNELRQKFWIIDGRAAVNRVWNSCQWCRVRKAKPV